MVDDTLVGPARVNFEWLWKSRMWSASKVATVGQTSGKQARPAVQERWTGDDVAGDGKAKRRLLRSDSIETILTEYPIKRVSSRS